MAILLDDGGTGREHDSSRAIAVLNRTIATDERVDAVLLTIRNAIQLVRER
ncbi:MAG: hypothetical protein WD672_05635 [Woeseia sp.]